MRDFFALGLLITSLVLTSCVTQDSPPLRRVSATEFMRPHTFKGLPTDQFIGTTNHGLGHSDDLKPDRAFKQIWEIGLFHSWAVIWCPVDELPADYLRNAHTQPNRPAHRRDAR